MERKNVARIEGNWHDKICFGGLFEILAAVQFFKLLENVRYIA